jgi:N-glycosylase/DNA lyase
VKRDHQPVLLKDVRATHKARMKEIQTRLAQFRRIWSDGSDAQLWEELVFCIFTAGASARMGFRAVEAIKPLLRDGAREEMTEVLKKAGAHRFPVERPSYIIVTRNYLRKYCGMQIRNKLQNFANPIERRDWLAQEKQIKGIGYKEASHFLRNVGFVGHAILDKHVMSCLLDLQVVDTAKPPATRARYLEVEERLRSFAKEIRIDFDELDLVLWSMKTGEVLK